MGTRRFRGLGLVALGAAAGILLSLGITAAAQRGESLPLKDLQQFANVFSAIKSSYVEPMTDEALINGAIRGLFTDLDPHSSYLDAEAFKEMETLTQGGFGGLGIELGTDEEGLPKVIAPIEDTPAARAGILSGDIITHIDGKPTKGMTLNGAIKLMRGEPNTPIELTIYRATADKPLTVKIVRDMIKVRSVRSKLLDGNIGYVRISQFQDRTVPDLVKHLYDLYKVKPPKALILDLRNDPGGLFDGAIGVSSVFLPPRTPVVSTKGRVPSANREYASRSAEPLFRDVVAAPNAAAMFEEWARKVPMVVLVNVGSASSSEIVAGALQDHKRATIIGNRTFGKGSVQSVLPLSEDSGIKLTTARYYTPNGRSIQVTGVEPDIVVADTAYGNLFRLPREIDLTRHLLNGAEEEPVEAVTVKGKPVDASEDDDIPADFKMFEFGGADDYQLRQAINHLEGRPVKRRDPPPARKADAAGSDAEKKTPRTSSTDAVERLRITPQGVQKTP